MKKWDDLNMIERAEWEVEFLKKDKDNILYGFTPKQLRYMFNAIDDLCAYGDIDFDADLLWELYLENLIYQIYYKPTWFIYEEQEAV